MDGIQKTKKHKRKFVPIDKLEANPDNPNEMDAASFNLLYDNIERIGITDPIFCIPHPDTKGMFRIVGGEHRWEVAKLQGFTEVPVTIVDDKNFTEDEQKFQIVRHNIIHGKMSPKKFMDLYQGLSEEYPNEVAAEMFGFTEQEEFLKLVSETKKGLPKEYHKEFDEAKKELKTIDDLASLLNKLFASHGDTLPHGYMIFDFGGKESVWLRLHSNSLRDFDYLGEYCKANNRSMEGVVGHLLHLISKGELDDLMDTCVAACDTVDVSTLDSSKLPTLDFLDA